jgi:hypothetical protein
MHLAIEDDRLTLTLQGLERLWAFRVAPITARRDQVVRAEPALPPSGPLDLRAPGTGLPGVIKAGTFYTRRGKEFWYAVRSRKDQPLTIELTGANFKRVAVTIEGATGWVARINAWIAER